MARQCSVVDLGRIAPAQVDLAGEVLERLSGKWVFQIIDVLHAADGPVRFARIHRAVEGISQKVLTRILRQLEQDGFVERWVYAEVPPRVEYRLTGLGTELMEKIAPLFVWIVDRVSAFEAARARSLSRDE